MYTIGQLSKEFQLSRGTLLHYDTIGLLKSAERTEGNYRLYSEDDRDKLKVICRYRETGMALEDIKRILQNRDRQTALLLEKRLTELNREVKKLNLQRQIIVYMLRTKKSSQNNTKDTFLSVMDKFGFKDAELHKLHVEYEQTAPEGHQAFLEFLGFTPEEIARLRAGSRQAI